MTMKQWILASIVLVMALGLGACSSDDESKGSAVDEYSELPAWLVPQAKALEVEFKDFKGAPSLCYSISRAAGIHGETVYHVYRIYDNCLLCNIYDEKGNQVDYIDVFGERDHKGDEGWVVLFPREKK
jgi:hypothetical protein